MICESVCLMSGCDCFSQCPIGLAATEQILCDAAWSLAPFSSQIASSAVWTDRERRHFNETAHGFRALACWRVALLGCDTPNATQGVHVPAPHSRRP
jgi:hypothetical protein